MDNRFHSMHSRRCRCRSWWLFCVWFVSWATVQTETVKVEYLNEILTGRCYYDPPTGIPGSCPPVVDYILSGLEDNVDSSISSSTFSSYFAGANFHPRHNRGLFWLKADSGTASETFLVVIPQGWNTPETTPGGAMMDGLNFCGVDLQQDCPRISRASTVFWTSAYGAYAKEVREEVHVILEKGAYLYPLLKGAIPNLSAESVSTVSLYATDCQSEEVLTTISAFSQAFNKSTWVDITCTDNLAGLALCQDPTSDGCQCLTTSFSAAPSVDPAAVVDKNMTIETKEVLVTPSSSNATAIHTAEIKDSNDRTYKVLFWVLLLVVLLGLYAESKRQDTKGYRTIPVHIDPTNAQQ